MKKVPLSILLLLYAGVLSVAQSVIINYKNGEVLDIDLSLVESITFEEAENHEWVDLGLPSGTLWATCNIGADSPEEYGDYFAWGETETKDIYNWSTYKYCNGSQYSLTKYSFISIYNTNYGYNEYTDTLTALQPEDDAATVLWGNKWQMPSEAQIHELFNSDYTSTEWVTVNGVDGRKITSWSNGRSIFLPATGYRDNQNHREAGNLGLYWSRTLSKYECVSAYVLSFDSNECYLNRVGFRDSGRCIRPVRVQKTPPTNLVTDIVLNETSITLQLDEVKTLTATVFPEDASNPAVTWRSSKTSVATVDQTGKVTAVGKGFCIITCKATDGSDVYAECQVTIEHEWVDLGLPSGTLWATCNIGADSPEEYGDYFAWGETEPKRYNTWLYYKWMNDGQETWTQINKYTTDDGQMEGCWYDADSTFIGDGLAELLPEDDAATVNWGKGWQMPSIDQMNELINDDYTTSSCTTQNDVNGCLITSKSNGNSIFLPAAGECDWASQPDYAGTLGSYWSRSLHPATSRCAYALYFFGKGKPRTDRYSSRFYGRPVRPVRKQ